jgi:hypothetical protein
MHHFAPADPQEESNMSAKRTVWRVAAPPGIAHAVLEISKKEGRSVANTIARLVGEAVDHRRAAGTQTDDVRRLVNILKGVISEAPADAGASC